MKLALPMTIIPMIPMTMEWKLYRPINREEEERNAPNAPNAKPNAKKSAKPSAPKNAPNAKKNAPNLL